MVRSNTMWSGRREKKTVTCIACGDSLSREEAREYDKHGDRWDRRDKEFEHLCKPCFADHSTHSRRGLEDLLEEIETGGLSQERFLRRYEQLVDGDGDSPASRDDPSR